MINVVVGASKLVLELFSVYQTGLSPPDGVIVGHVGELLLGIAHNFLCHQLLDRAFDWNVLTLRGSEVAAH